MRFRLNLAQKGLLLIAGPFLFQVLFVVILIHRQTASYYAEKMAMETKMLLLQTQDIDRHMLEAFMNFRSYVWNGDPAFQTACRDAVALSHLDLAAAKKSVDLCEPPDHRFAMIDRNARLLIAWFSQMDQFMATGRRDLVQSELRELKGQKMMDNLGLEVQTFLEKVTKKDRQRRENMELVTLQENWILGIGAVLMLLIALKVVPTFYRDISRRVTTITRSVEGFAAGKELEPMVGGDDEITRLDQAFHAMSHRLREAAEKERSYKEELEARALELIEANRELRQQNDENDMFVYSVSHDLRSPLVNLQGFSKELGEMARRLRAVMASPECPPALRQRAVALLDQEMDEAIHFIQNAVSRLAVIIDALLRLSRAGRVEYRCHQVDMMETVRRIVGSLQATASEKGATMEVRPLPPIWGDPSALEQIFGNLMGNALNYLDPKRAGRIEVGATDPSPKAGMTTYYVRDNGLGIAPAHLNKVFALFQRVHHDAGHGEGIGLAIVRRVVERHGGHVWVESVEHAGSSFYVALPSEPEGGAASAKIVKGNGNA